MPTGIYIRTKEAYWLGKKRPPFNEEWRKKMGDAHKKDIHWKDKLPLCLDCKKKVSRFDAKRCSGCATKFK